MHRLFRKALNNATGESKSVIAVILDIRDFSGFSQQCDSADVAAFIRKVYMKIIDTYFSFASFYKSTGDGLLFTIPCEEENLEEMSQKVIESCINCHSEFANICSGDPAINFKVPDKIGIGVARGSACCLVSGNRVIDYSGRLLNLTSRLNDLARPSGIVIDGAFVIDLLTEEQRGIFEEENVYLDGIAESEPIQIYFSKEFTTIPKRNKQPISAKRWRYVKDTKPYRDLLKFTRFRYFLESEATGEEDVKVTVTHSKVISGRVDKRYVTIIDFADFTYKVEVGKPTLWVDFAKLCEILKRYQAKKNMNVIIEIAYVEK